MTNNIRRICLLIAFMVFSFSLFSKEMPHKTTSEFSSFSVEMIVTNPSCYDAQNGIITAITNGGTAPYYFDWSDGHNLRTNPDLAPGNYAVTVTDLNGCTAIAATTVHTPQELTSNLIIQNGTCGNMGMLNIEAFGGTPPYQYSWENGETNTLRENLTAGEYTVTITDTKDCTTTAQATLVVDETELDFDIFLQAPSCHEDSNGEISVEVTSGKPPYSYSWSNGSTADEILNIAEGSYTVFITDANGCTDGLTVALVAPEPLKLNLTYTDSDAAVMVTGGTPPYSYEWSNGHDSQLNTGLIAGSYSVTVTDAFDCQMIGEVDLLGPLTDQAISSLESIDLYPNPVSDWLHLALEFSQRETLDLRIMNLKGELLVDSQITGNQVLERIDMSDFTAGVYFLSLSNDKGAVTKKVLVAR